MDEKNWKDPSPWVPMTRAIDQKHVGKLLEELGELIEVGSRCLEPDTDWLGMKPKLENEMADVAAGIALNLEHFGLMNEMMQNLSPLHGDGGSLLRDLVRASGGMVAALSRCLIQGIDGEEPVTKKPNRTWLLEATYELLGCMVDTGVSHRLDDARMSERVDFKIRHLKRWHGMLAHEA